MDSFDELAQALGRGVSRRTALRRFAGGLTAAVLATVVPWKAPTATYARPTNDSLPGIEMSSVMVSGVLVSSAVLSLSGLHGWSLTTWVGIGAYGPNVEAIQYLLRHHGNWDIVIDGDFGGQTDGAVRDFQAANFLDVDGIVGPITWAALIVTVQQGDWGDAVSAAQTLLNWHGAGIVVDGDFGDQTDGAVRAYQPQRGMTPDGIVEPRLWHQLIIP